MKNRFFLFPFFFVVCAFDFYGSDKKISLKEEYIRFRPNSFVENQSLLIKSKSGFSSEEKIEENNENKMALLRENETLGLLKKTTHFKRINKYPFAKTLIDVDNFILSWEQDFKGKCEKILSEVGINGNKTFFEFYFCHKIIKREGISGSGPFLSDNDEETFKDFSKDIHLFRERVCLVPRFNLDILLDIKQDGASISQCEEEMDKYVSGVIGIFKPNSLSRKNLKELNDDRYINLYKVFVLNNKDHLNKLYVRDLLSGVREGFVASIIKHRTSLFRFIPTFIYNIFDLGRFLKDFYTYSNDGRYSLSFYKVPLILGKTSPIFFNIFQVDFFFNFPLGVVLSCLDFCAYSILRGNLSDNEKKSDSSFQNFFLVWRPFVSDDVDIPSILEKSIKKEKKSENLEKSIEIEKKAENEEFFKKRNFEKEESHNAFAPVILKVLTNFVGINFNIKVKGNYFFSINIMSFVDDFILREYFLDSFNYFNDDFTPSSWSIFYVLDKKR